MHEVAHTHTRINPTKQSNKSNLQRTRLLIIFGLFFLTFSCSQEESSILPNADNAQHISYYSTSDENLESSAEEISLHREGCHCYMQVLSADNITEEISGFLYEHEWGLVDATSYSSGDMEIDGKGMDKWREDAGAPWKMLPTPFFELDELSYGTHMFYMIFLPISSTELDPPANFVIHTRVRCVNENSKGDEVPSGGEDYQVDFVWKDGGPALGDASIRYKPFWKTFSCGAIETGGSAF